MGNNNLKGTNDILIKVDQNNLIYLDPNSVLSNGLASPRGVEPENLVMYVNLEADLIPRTTLVARGDTNSLTSIAGGTLNFLQNKDGRDYDTKWTESYTNIPNNSSNFINTGVFSSPNNPSGEGGGQNDTSAQSFGIESVSIQITGANFIPRVVIKFIDVRGKTLFESPENSPYGPFFHLPWPIFYLTVKGYYGKAIKYRLHLIKFNSRFNPSNGNMEIETNFVGSTYAYMADISLQSILNAPYFYISESDTVGRINPGTKEKEMVVSKTTKGYRVLKSVYQEYIAKGLLPKDFPVRTLRELIITAGRINKTLEAQIFSEVIDPKILSGIKEFEDSMKIIEGWVAGWKAKNVSPVYFVNGKKRSSGEEIRWFKLSINEKNTLDVILGPTKEGTLERILVNSIKKLDDNQTFGNKRNNKLLKSDKLQISQISLSSFKNIGDYYTQGDAVGVDMDGLEDAVYTVYRNFIEQRNKLETDIEKQINEIVKDKTLGIGFEPTIRNIIGVVLANADTYVRLMKDVHDRAFESAESRKKLLTSVLTDSDKADQCIYPWPEVKAQSAGGRELVLLYPGARELLGKLQSHNKVLWPEVDFIENFYAVSTKKVDPLTGIEESIENVNYVFDSQPNDEKKDISVLTNLTNYIPYSDKSFSSILYEIYERAKYTASLNPFSNDVMIELANVEFENLKVHVIEDVDIVDLLKQNVRERNDLVSLMQSLSAFDRFPYYEDQLPTIPYLKSGLDEDYGVSKHVQNTNNTRNNNGDYPKLLDFLLKYKPESYRSNIYPFNSSTYENYLGHTFSVNDLNLNGFLTLNTPDDFITSPIKPTMWVKDGYDTNLFNHTITIGGVNKQLLNTPYFHKQLYSDFTKSTSQEKYVGSSYLLLNSLPFKDLDDTITYENKSILMSTLFREIGASHYVPYHMMLKWGAIYHRYKKYITESVDIIGGLTVPIDGDLFYNNNTSITYNNTPKSIGFHPFYEGVYHQITNGYTFFDPTLQSGYTNTILSGVTYLYSGRTKDEYTYMSLVDNSKFVSLDNRYTLLPTNGSNATDGTDFTKSEQESFRVIWGIGTDGVAIPDYSGYTFPSYNEYFKTTGSTETFSLSTNYRKVIDLISTFKPDVLDLFEHAFLDFASEKLNEEISYSLYDVLYPKFQDVLKKISSVSKITSDSSETISDLFSKVQKRQINELSKLSSDFLSNDNLVRIVLSNPREVDNYVLGGFTGVNVRHFSIDPYSSANPDDIELYLGEDIDGYYHDFFVVNDISETKENILQFRPLIYMYAGLRANNTTSTKAEFIEYLKTNILLITKDPVTGVSNQETRLNVFLNQLIGKIQSKDFEVKNLNQTATLQRGYNDDPIKLELYNYFKSFNDKWTAGNSIGQRTLLEEFLFLDKANKDIGNAVYLDMQRLTKLSSPGNKDINLFSLIGLLVQDSGFDIRALPAYVNFYGANYSSSKKTTPSKSVAQNMFGTFLDVDYQDSSPKIILQYTGPTSKHPELADIDKKYKYKNDGFDIGNVNNNPIIVAPDVFTKTDFTKSNKVVAFEVSFGDQNQSIFKGVELDQATLKNTSESFEVIERLGRNETGSSTSQIDIGLFDIYRQSSYQCTVTAMGNMMIQPTMYFYLKNVPLFRGSYLITEVTHNVKTSGIETVFKGTRIPAESLPNPADSFLASYRSLFDKLMSQARARVRADEEAEARALSDGNKQTIVTPEGAFTYNIDNLNIKGEKIVPDFGLTNYGIPFNGFDGEENIQLVTYQGNQWLRAKAVRMGGKLYKITDDIHMNIVTRLTTGGKMLPWGEVKGLSKNQSFYGCNFDINRKIDPDVLISTYTKTEFLNPNGRVPQSGAVIITVNTNINVGQNIYEGPITVGPSSSMRFQGYGIGMSDKLMRNLGLKDGDVVYFRLLK